MDMSFLIHYFQGDATGDQLNIDVFLMKIWTLLTIVLSLSGLTFAAELKINSGEAAMVIVSPDNPKTGYGRTDVPGWVRSKREIDLNTRKKAIMAVNPELSRTAKAAGYGRTDVPGWVRRSLPEVEPNIRKESLVSEIKKELIDHAKTYLGSPYKYGGNGFSGIDCSGFVKNVYDKFGVRLPRTARQQYMMGTTIGKEELSMGDLIFFRQRRSGYFSHVGIFLKDGKFIHFSARRNGEVRVDSLYDNLYRHTFMGARKLVE